MISFLLIIKCIAFHYDGKYVIIDNFRNIEYIESTRKEKDQLPIILYIS